MNIHNEDQKYNEFVETLKERCPNMFDNLWSSIECDEGWWPLIEVLSASIQNHILTTNQQRQALLESNPYNRPIPDEVVPVQIDQIKEKFGSLRYYYTGGDECIAGMVNLAEELSARICERCGNPGKIRTGGWLKTLCDEHDTRK